jgi:hypothetical protein
MFIDALSAGSLQPTPEHRVHTLDELRSRFRPDESHYLPHLMIRSPGSLLFREQLLGEINFDLSRLAPRTCVMSVFGPGMVDNDDRFTTRIGGVPFWLNRLPWPTTTDGRDYLFLAQLDFRVVTWPEQLPGDILVIHEHPDHAQVEHTGKNHVERGFRMTWLKSSDASEAASVAALSDANRIRLTPAYYSIPVVCTDYKFVEDTVSDLDSSEIDALNEHAEVLTLHGTKIGGHSPFSSDNWRQDFPDPSSLVFLCSVGSIVADSRTQSLASWLPEKNLPDVEQEDLLFMDDGVLTILYDKGRPDQLSWIMYMP